MDGDRDVLAMLESRRVASNITRLLLAGAACALLWAALKGFDAGSSAAALAFIAFASAFITWQRLAPSGSSRTLVSFGLSAGAVLVVSVSALIGVDQGPFA